MAADTPPMTLDEAQRLFDRPALTQPADASNTGAVANPVAKPRNEAQKAHAQAIVDTALSVGLKAGLVWQLHNIQTAVGKMPRFLDNVYNFQPLMIQARVVPPVITEARNLYNQDGDYSVRLSGAYYHIETQARFASVSPNWRDYLTFPQASIDRDDIMSMLIPATDEERAAWSAGVKNGWDQGVEQANLMLTQAMERLNRDYVGMSRFHRFVIAGKITMPAIASANNPVSRNGATMIVDDTLLRITTLPEFDAKKDRIIAASPKAAASSTTTTAVPVPLTNITPAAPAAVHGVPFK
jgi:defect-in-organelle-trafficking protein DotC